MLDEMRKGDDDGSGEGRPSPKEFESREPERRMSPNRHLTVSLSLPSMPPKKGKGKKVNDDDDAYWSVLPCSCSITSG
jgi:hypothetical protein